VYKSRHQTCSTFCDLNEKFLFNLTTNNKFEILKFYLLREFLHHGFGSAHISVAFLASLNSLQNCLMNSRFAFSCLQTFLLLRIPEVFLKFRNLSWKDSYNVAKHNQFLKFFKHNWLNFCSVQTISSNSSNRTFIKTLISTDGAFPILSHKNSALNWVRWARNLQKLRCVFYLTVWVYFNLEILWACARVRPMKICLVSIFSFNILRFVLIAEFL
jgi:hypothetical protein